MGSGGGFHHVCDPFDLLQARASDDIRDIRYRSAGWSPAVRPIRLRRTGIPPCTFINTQMGEQEERMKTCALEMAVAGGALLLPMPRFHLGDYDEGPDAVGASLFFGGFRMTY